MVRRVLSCGCLLPACGRHDVLGPAGWQRFVKHRPDLIFRVPGYAAPDFREEELEVRPGGGKIDEPLDRLLEEIPAVHGRDSVGLSLQSLPSAHDGPKLLDCLSGCPSGVVASRVGAKDENLIRCKMHDHGLTSMAFCGVVRSTVVSRQSRRSEGRMLSMRGRHGR